METKIETIVSHFGFSNLDDATLNLSKVLCHPKQEFSGSAVVPKVDSRKIADEVCKRLERRPYERLICGCIDFSALLVGIGKYFGHVCEPVEKNADYLQGNYHVLVRDETSNRLRDSTIYRSVYDWQAGKWVLYKDGFDKSRNVWVLSQGILDMNDIPEYLLKKV